MAAKLIQVSYSSSSWRLDDKDVYTHFLRTQPTHTRMATNLVQVLKNLTYSKKAEINSVVQIKTNSRYGLDGAQVSKTSNIKHNKESCEWRYFY